MRLCSDADIERLQLIKHMKPLGISVQNIEQFASQLSRDLRRHRRKLRQRSAS